MCSSLVTNVIPLVFEPSTLRHSDLKLRACVIHMLTHYLPLFLNCGTHFCCCTHVSNTYNTFSLICNTYQLPLSTRIHFWTSRPVFEHFEPIFKHIAHSLPTTALFWPLPPVFWSTLLVFTDTAHFQPLPSAIIIYILFSTHIISFHPFFTYSWHLLPVFSYLRTSIRIFKPFHSFFNFCLPIFVLFTYLVTMLIFFNCFRALPHVGRVPKYCRPFVNVTTCLDMLPIIINCLRSP